MTKYICWIEDVEKCDKLYYFLDDELDYDYQGWAEKCRWAAMTQEQFEHLKALMPHLKYLEINEKEVK